MEAEAADGEARGVGGAETAVDERTWIAAEP